VSLQATQVADRFGSHELDFKSSTRTAVVIFIGYLIGADSAFFIGTLSDKIFAPLWPPNIVLMAALLLVPRDRAWLCIAASFPAHVLVEAGIGMPALPLLVAFGTNVAMAISSAEAIRLLLGAPPRLHTVRHIAIYIVSVGLVCPAVIAFGGASVRILAGGPIEQYFVFWFQWFAANALGSLTLGPIALIFIERGAGAFWPGGHARQMEAAALFSLLLLLALVVLEVSGSSLAEPFIPALIYAPFLVAICCAIRFGVMGGCAAALIVTVILIWSALHSSSSFPGGDIENNVLALQAFLILTTIPTLLLGALADQNREVEDRLDKAEDRVSLAAATANAGFWQKTAGSQHLGVNHHGRFLLGLTTTGDLTRESILAIVHSEDTRAAANALADPEITTHHPEEFRVVLPDGRQRWILSRSQTKSSQDGDQLDTSGIFVDITARKVAEAEADRQHRELAHLMRVSQAGELSNSLAHELTQPLTSILANAQAARLIVESKPSDISEVVEILDEIIHEDQRAGEVIRRLRTLIKKGDIRSELVDVNNLCEASLTLLHTESITRDIQLKLIPAAELPKIVADPVQVQQVLINLVMNAMEAVQAAQSTTRAVVIRTTNLGKDGIEIQVDDHGPGISATNKTHLFEPFFTTKERGLGLGLPICSAIAKRHGGTLKLENNAVGGATACVHLPLRPPGDPCHDELGLFNFPRR